MFGAVETAVMAVVGVATTPFALVAAKSDGFFSQGTLGALVQIVVAVAASGVLVKVLTLRQDRRKIAGEASTSEANAASTLSGAALQMVQAAQRTAADADTRAVAANANSEKVRQQNETLWRELNRARWEIHWLKNDTAVMEEALRRAGVEVPHTERPVSYPDLPPPTSDNGPPPSGREDPHLG